MWRPPPPLASLQLRCLLRRCTSSPFQHPPSPRSIRHCSPSPFTAFLSRPFSSYLQHEDETLESAEIAQSISSHLAGDALSVAKRLGSEFSTVAPSPPLIVAVLNRSPEAGRSVLGLLHWVASRPDSSVDDATLSAFVAYFGRRRDFKAVHDLLRDAARGAASGQTFRAFVDRLVRAGRPTQAVALFDSMEKDYGLARDKEALKVIVGKLCDHGFASYAEKMVKNLANEFFPDEKMCDLLIKGWCVDGKLDEARRLAGDMYRGGFEIGAAAYNAILDCVCKLCRKKDPFRLQSESQKVLVDMDVAGVPRNVETFNVLITNLCKIRKTEDALKVFDRMGEWGCCPNETTFLVLIRSLYQAARVGEGDEMIDRMKSTGFGEALGVKAYYGLIKILCGIERIDHAMKVFAMMKKDGCNPGIKTYDLLMGKLVAHGRVDRANALFSEAEKRGVPVTPKAYKLDPRFTKKPEAKKKEKKRETLPEKMARKRKTLKKIRLSFVKKPRRSMLRSA